MSDIADERIQDYIDRLRRDADRGGYHLHPDADTLRDLAEGLIANEERYGYPSCPCRLASGERDADLDIICPCYYRDPDLGDFDQCYCALYVNEDILSGEREASSIPERRPLLEVRERELRQKELKAGGAPPADLSQPVWRCQVCGYLCGRESPPERCPICKANKDRFERFM